MKKTICILLVGFSFFSVSCKKKTTTPTSTVVTPTTNELLTGKNWTISNYTSTDTTTATSNILKEWKSTYVDKSVYLTFKTDGTYLYSDSSDYGKWELSGDKTIVYAKGTPDESTSTIEKLTTTEFVHTYEETISSKKVKITEYTVKK